MSRPPRVQQWLTRIRYLLHPRPQHEIDDELAFHLEQQTQAYLEAGVTPRNAHRQARIDLGGLERAREQTHAQRPTFLLETAAQDVRFHLRSLRRNRTFTLTVIATMMLGIGATTAVFSVVDRILFRSLPYAHAEQLVSVGLEAPIEPDEFMLGGSYYHWQDNQQPFAALTSETGIQPCDLTEERPARLSCAHVEANFLPTLGVAPFLGRSFTPAEDTPHGPAVALLSHALWHSRFASDPAVIGRLLHIDGRSLQIVGVLPANFEMPRRQKADLLLPEALDVAAQRRANPGQPLWAFARLKPGVTLAQARQQLQPLFTDSLRDAPPQFRREVHLKIRSLRDRQTQDVHTAAWILFGLVLAVLLIACANIASLMLARSTRRNRETAVRAALGASRARLAQQALTESLLLGLAGLALGLALAAVLLRSFRALAPEGLPFLDKANLDPRIVGFALLAAIACALLFGLGPALSRPLLQILSGRTFGTRAHARARRWLVTGQLSASMVLLVVCVLLTRSFVRLERQSFGFDTHNVLTVKLSLGQSGYPTGQQQQAFFNHLEQGLRYGPGITGLAISDTVPPGGEHHDQIFASLAVAGQPPAVSGTGGDVTWRWVTPEYFRLLDIPLLRGSGFTDEQRDAKGHFAVLSRSLATRLFPTQDSLGRQIHVAVGAPEAENPPYTVVGIVADVKNAGLAGKDEPEYYRLRRDNAADWSRDATFILKTNLPPATLDPWVRSRVAALDPTLPVKFSTLTASVAEFADQPRFETFLVSLFALIGLSLATLGLYGVIAYLVAQRTQEIGVRMALGASKSNVLALFVRSGLRMLLPGLVLGALLSWMLADTLSSILFQVSPHDPAALAGSAGLLFLIAVAAMLVPAFTATRVQPATVLRSE